jgi:hypothetical protein
MTDQEFIEAFEAGTLRPDLFDHRAHLRAAYCYLGHQPFLEACIAMRNGLQSFAGRVGKAGLYHETVTIAYMSLLAERMRGRPDAGWEALIAEHPELLDRHLLARHYRPGTLASPAAKACFMLGDAGSDIHSQQERVG